MADIPALAAALDGIETSTDRALLRLKSRDFYWYSPILKAQLDGKARPASPARGPRRRCCASSPPAARSACPVTVRGGGTGNYGQCVPLEGGVVLDMTAMARPVALADGVVEVEAGAKMIDLDLWCRDRGWELKLWPSTKRTATIGGFVAGGGAGVGGIAHGTLRERGNLLGARVATMQDPPAILDLEGDEAAPVNRTYGTTGVMTRIRLPLAPAQAWRDVAIAFDDFVPASRFALALAFADGIPKKMCAVFDSQLPPFFRAIADAVPAGRRWPWRWWRPPACARCATWRASMAADRRRPGHRRRRARRRRHALLRILLEPHDAAGAQARPRRHLPAVPLPVDDTLQAVEAVRTRFRDEVWMHTECVRFGGRTTMSALPVVRWTSAERLYEIIAAFEAEGIGIANPHVLTIEEGSNYRRVPGDQLGFKRMADPLGLLNPGKMRDFTPEDQAA
jgi:FAD/FMN-containing dehydrogenase